jgi:hypothetical protein
MSFVAAGAVTGIGSLPLTSISSAVRSVAEFSPEIPFWPQLPQLSEQESIVGQGLGIVENLIDNKGAIEYQSAKVRVVGRLSKQCFSKWITSSAGPLSQRLSAA